MGRAYSIYRKNGKYVQNSSAKTSTDKASENT
jgi:hypothetical protein